MKYLLNEIMFFQESMIPLQEYPKQVKILRNKVNKYFNTKLLYIKRMFYNKEIDEQEYKSLNVIIEYEKNKFLNLF